MGVEWQVFAASASFVALKSENFLYVIQYPTSHILDISKEGRRWGVGGGQRSRKWEGRGEVGWGMAAGREGGRDRRGKGRGRGRGGVRDGGKRERKSEKESENG